MLGIMGKKVGMTAIFDDRGHQIPCTVIETGGNIVVDKKTAERDGYTALVVGFGEQRASRLNKPQLGFFTKQGLVTSGEKGDIVKRHIKEFRVEGAELESRNVGDEVVADDIFYVGEKIDVTGTSKGRGFTGVMKRHNFKGGKATHGVHEYYRHGGSIGQATYPARVFKNKKMPGQHGNKRVGLQNLQVVKVIAEENLILVRGGVPGPNGGLVELAKAAKRLPGAK
jgi:large subunit ribosomal protein L3